MSRPVALSQDVTWAPWWCIVTDDRPAPDSVTVGMLGVRTDVGTKGGNKRDDRRNGMGATERG